MATNGISFCLALCVLLSPIAGAQSGQPNSAAATLSIEGQEGPPYPIINVFVYGGTTARLDLRGGANVHFLVAQAPSLTPNPFPFLGGVVDLDIVSDPSAVVALMDGFGNAPDLFKTDGNGRFTRTFVVPPAIPQNLQVAYQAVVEDPASPYLLELSAATSILTFQGITPVPFSLGDDDCVFVNTSAQYNIDIPFYATTYSGCFVCSNGFLTFGSGDNGFTPSYSQMHNNQPRIAPFWSDLHCGVATSGPVTLLVDQIDPANPVLTFKYSHISDWPTGVTGGIGYHTFGVRMDITSGDVEIHEFPSNDNSNFDILIGMGAGGALDPTGAAGMDLSAQFALGPYVGAPNEGMYEGFRGATSITGTFPPSTFDLAGNYWRYNAVGGGQGVGTPGTYYIMDYFIPVDPQNP